MPINGLCIPIVTCKGRFFYTSCEVEYFESSVVTSGNEFGIIGGEGDASYRIIVSLYCFDVVEVRLPVLDNAIIAGRKKPVLIMRVSCCPNCDVVGLIVRVSMAIGVHWVSTNLHDSLEVEGGAIPKGKFAAI